MSTGWKSFYQLLSANILMAVVGLIKFPYLPPQIPLFYSKPVGDEQLADIWFILILPLLMNLLFLLNNFVEKKYFAQDAFIGKIFYYTNLFILISFTLIFAKIVFLVS